MAPSIHLTGGKQPQHIASMKGKNPETGATGESTRQEMVEWIRDKNGGRPLAWERRERVPGRGCRRAATLRAYSRRWRLERQPACPPDVLNTGQHSDHFRRHRRCRTADARDK